MSQINMQKLIIAHVFIVAWVAGEGSSLWKESQGKAYRAHESKRSCGGCLQSAEASFSKAHCWPRSTGAVCLNFPCLI